MQETSLFRRQFTQLNEETAVMGIKMREQSTKLTTLDKSGGVLQRQITSLQDE